MPLTNPSFFSINADFAASTATNAQLSLQDTAIAAQVFGVGGRLLGPISLTDMQNANSVYDGAANYGWIIGGNIGPTSSIERIDFSNDLVRASTRGPQISSAWGFGAVNNTNYGWLAGMFDGGAVSTVQRIDFANDSPGSTSPRGPISQPRFRVSGIGNNNYGWIAGGSDAGVPITNYSRVDRIDYSNDNATASIRGPLIAARWATAAAGNSNYGWIAGGLVAVAGSGISTIERLDYSNDSPTSPIARASLPLPRGAFAATSNSNYGWFGGGYLLNTINLSSVHRIDFANDSPTSASPRGPLTVAKSEHSATGNANYGWFAAGGPNPSPGTTTVERIDYSNDTITASSRGQLNIARYNPGATSNYVKSEKGVLFAAQRPFTEVWSINTYTSQATWVEIPGTYGWFAGGWTPGASAVVDRIDFANDSPTSASPRGPLSQGRTQMGSGNNSNYGWFFGGYVPGVVSTVDRIDFGNDSPTSALARNSLPSVTGQYPVGMPNGYSYLWMTSTNSIVLRLDFSNDGVAQTSRGTYSPSQGQQGGSNQFYGWITGGKPSSRVERIDFSNDSPTSASTRGPLLATRGDGTFSGNRNYGWVITGYPGTGPFPSGISSVERIDYSNDSPTSPSPRGNIPVSARTQKSSGNNNYGWIGGGAPTLSSVYRIDYANDTASATTRGPITVAREMGASSSNFVIGRSQPAGTTTSTAYFPASIVPVAAVAGSVGTYGWFTGGYGTPNGGRSVVDRIDFASDSPTAASPRGQLPSGKNANAATSNANYGWVTGGGSPNNDVFRIEFANDLALASPRAAMNTGRQDLSAAGNINYGWFGGGAPGAVSRVERINYANDTVSPSIRGPLSQGRQSGAAMANNSYGWWTGGDAPGNVSTVDRIDFANDSPTAASPRGALPITNRDLAAQGNSNFGWVSGGNPGISTVYRIAYSTDTVSAITRGPLTKVRTNFKGMGSATFGWVGPSSQGDSSIDRIDYSNDGSAASARGNLTLSRFSMAAISNYSQGAAAVAGNLIITTTATTTATAITLYTTSTVAVTDVEGTFGWFISGMFSGTSRSWVQRIDFSNDLVTASQRGPAGRIHSSAGGVSNSAFGWAAGGQTPTVNSAVDRIDFSNDSPTAAGPRSVLSATRQDMASASNSNYGWFGGGMGAPVGSGFVNTVDRIDFANDSVAATTRGPLSAFRNNLAATSDGDYGWFGGGRDGLTSRVSIVDRIDFANDSPTAASPRSNLAVASQELAATGNSNYGWFGAGETFAPTTISTVQRIDYANDLTTASPRGTLAQNRRTLGAVGNSNYGWFAGGIDQPPAPVSISSIERIDYANDLVTPSPRGSLIDITRYHSASVSNYTKRRQIVSTFSSIIYYNNFFSNSNFGWFGGGFRAGPIPLSLVDRIDFANDSPTVAPRGAPLSQAQYALAATGNANYGWFSGGFTGATSYSTINRIDFSNDVTSAAAQRGPLSSVQAGHAAAGNNNYGWHGRQGIDRIDYANDLSVASARGVLGDTLNDPVAFANQNYGWWAGGYSPPQGQENFGIFRIDFANDSPTTASLRSSTSFSRNQAAAVSNNSYGWIGGGQFGGSLFERINFANDTAATSTRGSLNVSSSRSGLSATGNNNYGWFGGGYVFSATFRSEVDRLDFANDTAASSSRGPLSIGKSQGAAASNTAKDNRTFSAINGSEGTHGWFGGGIVTGPTTVSSVNRIDFANDSPTAASPRGPLTSARERLAALGNASYGWFGGGNVAPSPTRVSTVDRIDFANDSPATASPRGPLSVARDSLAAVGNANYGWFGGGSTPVVGTDVIDRIDFANDSPTSASPRSVLTQLKYRLAAVGNANYGWFVGGYRTGALGISSVDRVDFANDSPTSASPRGLLSYDQYYHAATGNANYGWFVGGLLDTLPGISSLVSRIDYSNDLSIPSPRGPLSIQNYSLSAAGNANYGWFGGGRTVGGPGASSIVQRIDWANDSPTSASPRGPLSAGRYESSGASNYVQSRTEILASSPVNWPGGTWIRGGLSIA